MKKEIIKIILFLIIFCILFYGIFYILWLEPNAIHSFYKEPENSLDVIYIGASSAYTSFNSCLAYDKYGYKVGMLSTGSQPFTATKYIIKEAQKYQNPSLYVIDLGKVAYDLNAPEGEIRQITDAMKFSKNRTDTINSMLSYTDIDKSEYINYYYSFLLYHNRWKNLNYKDFGGLSEWFKGFVLAANTTERNPQDEYFWTEDILELQEENKQVLTDLIDYIKSNDLNVLFIIPIRHYGTNYRERMNYAIKMIEKNGFNVINFNKKEDYLDVSKDFYDAWHMNIYGATKHTLKFAKYLQETYNLKNNKTDDQNDSWNKEYNRLKKQYKKLTDNNFDDLLKEYNI